MKKYKLFAGHHYYPSGGMYDFRGDFDTKEEATESLKEDDGEFWYDWVHVVDTLTWEVTKLELF